MNKINIHHPLFHPPPNHAISKKTKFIVHFLTSLLSETVSTSETKLVKTERGREGVPTPTSSLGFGTKLGSGHREFDERTEGSRWRRWAAVETMGSGFNSSTRGDGRWSRFVNQNRARTEGSRWAVMEEMARENRARTGGLGWGS